MLSSGWQQSIHRANGYAALNDNPAATVVYLDPPYINKADQIYTLPFTGRDHRELAAYLKASPHRWVLSYDAEPLILDLYRGRSDVHRYRVTHHYTMTGKRKKAVPGREVIFTNLPIDPTAGTDCSR